VARALTLIGDHRPHWAIRFTSLRRPEGCQMSLVPREVPNKAELVSGPAAIIVSTNKVPGVLARTHPRPDRASWPVQAQAIVETPRPPSMDTSSL
jgi:hypothetical protein